MVTSIGGRAQRAFREGVHRRLLQLTGATVGATLARQMYGYDGTGITVAVIDSGVTPRHDDLANASGSQRVDR